VRPIAGDAAPAWMHDIAAQGKNEMQRRDMLRWLATSVALGELPIVLRAWEAAQVPEVEVLKSGHLLNGELVEQIEAVGRAVWIRWHDVPLTELAVALRGFDSYLNAITVDASPTYRPALLRVSSLNASLAGLVARSLGQSGEAGAWLNRAYADAFAAGDSHRAALALLWQSDIGSSVQRGAAGPSPTRVALLIRRARELCGGTQELAGYVEARYAEELAANGDAEDAQWAMERALALLSQPSGDGLFGRPWRPALTAAFQGNVALLSRQPRYAAHILRPIVEGLRPDAITSDGIAAMVDLAAALARQRDLEGACGLLTRAWGDSQRAHYHERGDRVRGVWSRELATTWPTDRRVRRVGELIGARA
jgi:hypothetical protein